MSYQQLLSIGYIPQNHSSGLISCGDPVGSGTSEITFTLEDDVVTSNSIPDLSLDGSGSDWFDIDDPIWSTLTDATNKFLNQPTKLTPEVLAGVWCHLMDEPLEEGPEILELDAEFGEFENQDSDFNDRFYFRYQQVEDDEFTSDQILIC